MIYYIQFFSQPSPKVRLWKLLLSNILGDGAMGINGFDPVKDLVRGLSATPTITLPDNQEGSLLLGLLWRMGVHGLCTLFGPGWMAKQLHHSKTQSWVVYSVGSSLLQIRCFDLRCLQHLSQAIECCQKWSFPPTTRTDWNSHWMVMDQFLGTCTQMGL